MSRTNITQLHELALSRMCYAGAHERARRPRSHVDVPSESAELGRERILLSRISLI